MSQSVKSAEKGGLASTATAYAGKLKGKKRHVLVDTQGLLLHRHRRTFRIATAVSRCWRPCCLFPFLGKLFADSAYQGPVFQSCPISRPKSSDRVKGFVVQPRPNAPSPGQPLPPTGQGLGNLNRRARLHRRPFDSCSICNLKSPEESGAPGKRNISSVVARVYTAWPGKSKENESPRSNIFDMCRVNNKVIKVNKVM